MQERLTLTAAIGAKSWRESLPRAADGARQFKLSFALTTILWRRKAETSLTNRSCRRNRTLRQSFDRSVGIVVFENFLEGSAVPRHVGGAALA